MSVLVAPAPPVSPPALDLPSRRFVLTPLEADAAHPDVEWCEDCALEREPFHLEESPGLPVAVLRRWSESYALPSTEWDPRWGPAPVYDLAELACGHLLCQLA